MEALTGMWVNFFTAAGIPSDVGATYAITFTENRIQSDMLLDLNKEYLRDMGISRMGDVIAILRHAKLVHEYTARERVLSSASPGPRVPVAAVAAQSKLCRAAAAAATSSSSTAAAAAAAATATALAAATAAAVPPPKSSSPASRMLEHYIRNPPAAAADLEPRATVKRRIVEAGGSSSDTKKVRHIEITASASTLSNPALATKKNVFSRLGATNESGKSEAPKEAEPRTIFSRLGNKSLTVNVGEIQRYITQDGGDKALQYEGILKNQTDIKKVVFSTTQQSAPRKTVSTGTMRADEAPLSVKALQYEGILKNQTDIKKVVFSTTQQSAPRKTVSTGTMRADQAPLSVKEKLAVPKPKSVKFSDHVDFKEIEPVLKERIFFQSVNTQVIKPARADTTVFNKPERRLTMPSASGSVSVPEVKSRLGSIPTQLVQRNVFNRLGQP